MTCAAWAVDLADSSLASRRGTSLSALHFGGFETPPERPHLALPMDDPEHFVAFLPLSARVPALRLLCDHEHLAQTSRPPTSHKSGPSPGPLPAWLGTCGLPVLQGHGEHGPLLQALQKHGHQLGDGHAAGGPELIFLFMQRGQHQPLPTLGLPEGERGQCDQRPVPPSPWVSPQQPQRGDLPKLQSLECQPSHHEALLQMRKLQCVWSHTGPGDEHGSALALDFLCAWADEPELRVLFYGLQRQWWCQACLWSQLWAGKAVAGMQGHHGATTKKAGAEMEHQPG